MHKIMILYDQSSLLEMLEVVLFHRGFQVISDISVKDVLSVIIAKQPDLIIINYHGNEYKGRAYYTSIQQDNYTKSIPLMALVPACDHAQGLYDFKDNSYRCEHLCIKDLVDNVKQLLGLNVDN